MTILASIRIKPDHSGATRPDQARLDEAAALLEADGFEVLYVGSNTLEVEVSEQDFERVLGVSAPGPQGMSSSVDPSDGDLRGLVELVEVFPPARYYGY